MVGSAIAPMLVAPKYAEHTLYRIMNSVHFAKMTQTTFGWNLCNAI